MSIKDIIYALIVNIALLAIIANLLSRIQTVQKLILQEKRGLKGDLILSMIFAGLIILSTCIGVKITSYSGPGGNKSVSTGRVGNVRSPKGDIVRETSAYGRVKFDIKNIIDGSFITKTKDIYCTLEIKN